MSLKVYASPAVRKRIEQSRTFAGTTPINAAIEADMGDLTLKQLARRLTKQLSKNNDGLVGVTISSVTFSPILDPEKIDNFR